MSDDDQYIRRGECYLKRKRGKKLRGLVASAMAYETNSGREELATF